MDAAPPVDLQKRPVLKPRDPITPHQVVVAALVHYYVQEAGPKPRALALWLLQDLRGGTSYVEPTFQVLQTQILATGQQGKQAWRHVLTMLQEIRRLDNLFDFFDRLEDLVTGGDRLEPEEEAKLDHGSMLGVYIRSMLLSWNQLMFPGQARLMESLLTYLLSNPMEEYASPVAAGPLGAFMTDRAENNEQTLGKESMTHSLQITQDLISSWASPRMSQPLFLEYLHHLNHHNLDQALASLHRYFDYLCTSQLPEDSSQTSRVANRQYAILNLALLHYKFGHLDRTIPCLLETVRIAQQNADQTCLAHALALLAQVAQNKASEVDSGSKRYGKLHVQCVVTQCQNAAKSHAELRLGESMRVEGREQEYKMELDNRRKVQGGIPAVPVPPIDAQSWIRLAELRLTTAVENVEQEQDSSVMTDQDDAAKSEQDLWIEVAGGAVAGKNPPARGGAAGQIGSARHPASVWAALASSMELCLYYKLPQLMVSNMLMRSQAWSVYGNRTLATLWSSIVLRYFGDEATAQDLGFALTQHAQLVSPELAETVMESSRQILPYPSAPRLASLQDLPHYKTCLTTGPVLAHGVTVCTMINIHTMATVLCYDTILSCTVLRTMVAHDTLGKCLE
eukprot:g10793.t1